MQPAAAPLPTSPAYTEQPGTKVPWAPALSQRRPVGPGHRPALRCDASPGNSPAAQPASSAARSARPGPVLALRLAAGSLARPARPLLPGKGMAAAPDGAPPAAGRRAGRGRLGPARAGPARILVGVRPRLMPRPERGQAVLRGVLAVAVGGAARPGRDLPGPGLGHRERLGGVPPCPRRERLERLIHRKRPGARVAPRGRRPLRRERGPARVAGSATLPSLSCSPRAPAVIAA